MSDANSLSIDPRIRRTHQLLHSALSKLMETKEFARISVQDITEAATLNRATFYAHYPDKYALLECVVGSRFGELLADRGVSYNGTCASALTAIVLGICDYLAQMPRSECEGQRQMEPHLESAVIAVVRKMILEGMRSHPSESSLSPEITATTISWAIYGAAKEWVRTPNRCSSDEIAPLVTKLIAPLTSPMLT